MRGAGGTSLCKEMMSSSSLHVTPSRAPSMMQTAVSTSSLPCVAAISDSRVAKDFVSFEVM